MISIQKFGAIGAIAAIFLSTSAPTHNAFAEKTTDPDAQSASASPSSIGEPLPAPSGLRATAQPDGTIKLSWNKHLQALGYRIFYHTITAPDTTPTPTPQTPKPLTKTLGPKDTSAIISDLTPGTPVTFTLAALDQFGEEGRKSAELTITPLKTADALVHPARTTRVSAWIPTSWDKDDALSAFQANADLFDTASFFWFNLEPDGHLSAKGGARDAALITYAHQHGIKVIPTITNNYDSAKTSAVLRDPALLATHIEAIMAEITGSQLDGIDIDYEDVASEDRAAYTAFIQQLAARLHAEQKLLIVTIQPKQSDGSLWDGPGATDEDAIGAAADRVRVMTYDYHRKNTVPGAIAPASWIATVLAYTKKHIPAEKIEAGIPFYGYDWCEDGTGEDAGVVWDGVQNLLRIHKDQNIEVKWDAAALEPYFNYNDGSCKDVVYFQDTRSIAAKLDVVTAQGVGGISIWRLGSEDPAFFDQIRTSLHKLPTPPNALSITPGNKKIDLSWKVTDAATTTGYRLYYGATPDALTHTIDLDAKQGAYTWTAGLANDTSVYFALVSRNKENRESERSATLAAATPVNAVPPAQITDLAITRVDATALTVSWTAPGDDEHEGTAATYDIRVSDQEIDSTNWDTATTYPTPPTPNAAGTRQSWEIRDLASAHTYWVAIRTFDAKNNASLLSTPVSATTVDVVAPAAPTALHADNTDHGAHLTWQLGSEKDLAGYVLFIKPAADSQFSSHYVGLHAETILADLANDTPYDAYLVALDEHGNRSAQSSPIQLNPRAYTAGEIPYFSLLDSLLINPRLSGIAANALLSASSHNLTQATYSLAGFLFLSSLGAAALVLRSTRPDKKKKPS